MKKVFLLLACLCGVGTVQGWEECSPCSGLELGAEVIWMRPSSCDAGPCIQDGRTFNVTDQPDRLPVGAQCPIKVDYDFGFRARAGYAFDCDRSDVLVQYTRLHTTEKGRSLANPEGTGNNPAQSGALWPTYADPKFLDQALYNAGTNTTIVNQRDALCQGRRHHEYDAGDIQVAAKSVHRCRLYLRTFAGIHLARIEEDRRVEFQGTYQPDVGGTATQAVVVAVRGNTRTWGAGTRVGVEGRFDLICGLGLGGRLGMGLIAGQTRNSFSENGTLTDNVATPNVIVIDSRVDSCYRGHLVPELDARVGVNAIWRCNNGFHVLFELGYEMISYVHALGQATFNDQGGTRNDHCYSFDLDGVYFLARLMF